MKTFSEWALHLVPTLILLLVAVMALMGSLGWVVRGFMSVLAASNIMSGFFSHITKIAGMIVGAS